MAHASPTAVNESRTTLGLSICSWSFVGLLGTQLLTAVNDNVFRWLVIGIGKDYVDVSRASSVLTAGTVCFVVPYLVLAAPAGYLADRFSKRTVIVGCKLAEVAIMAFGVLAIGWGGVDTLLVVLALMGTHSALFSPSKLGSIPELLRPEAISAANGWFGLTTVSAAVIGMAVGSWLSDATGYRGQERIWLSALVLLGTAGLGVLMSLLIHRLPAADRSRRIPWNLAAVTIQDLRALRSNRAILRVALGIMFFWSLGALGQMNIDQFAAEGGALNDTAKVPLLISLVLGLGAGSVLAGLWSAGRVELGMLPLGALGVSVSSILLFAVQGTIIRPEETLTMAFIVACGLLFCLGGGAGVLSVPLEAYLQHRSPVATRGSILAASNFLTFSGITLCSLLFWGLRAPVYPGSLDNVPPSLRGLPFSAESQRRVDEMVKEFDASRQGDDPPRIEKLLTQAGKPERAEALTQMLWRELRATRERGDRPNSDDYYRRFPDDTALVKAVYDQATDLPLFTAQQIFLLAGIVTVPLLFYIVWLIPQATIRFMVWLASCTLYRVRVFGLENLPAEGGALLVSNHVSWLDGILLLLTSSRPVRMMVYAGNFDSRVFRRLADMWGAIQIGSKPKQLAAALKTAREALQNGELVCIFPEGGITRSGQLLSFRPGLMKVLEGTDAPVLPIYLDGLWGSIFSFERGKFFWKLPRKIPYPIYIHFGKPIPKPDDVYNVRQVVQQLGSRAVRERLKKATPLVLQFIRTCRKRRFRPKVADSTGAALTGGQLLARTLGLRRLLRRRVLGEDERFVGVFLPPSAAAIATNMALAVDRRIAVNLNYTVSNDIVNDCIAQAGIRHVLTSRRFMEKVPFALNAECVYLEDLKGQFSLLDRLVAGFQAFGCPARLLAWTFGAFRAQIDDLVTVIFTSGSTGKPKGVMLTHGNVLSNIEAVEQIVKLSKRDVLVGVLPFFHSFGYTITMWTVATIDTKGVYHFSPLDAQQVGKLCSEHNGTLLLTTATFLRMYIRRCKKEDLRSLEVVIAGAEKLPKDVCDDFEEKFGVRPIEGYGTTELSPLVSVNVPPTRSAGFQIESKEGTVGRPIPGVAAKIVRTDTGEDLPAGADGKLLIAGPNVMKGYLNRPDLTAEVMRDEWYVTGDIARIDEDGFIQITGRESRFSKIGGEMVPHMRIEEVLAQLAGKSEDGGLRVAVTAVSDPKKGERLIVLHTRMEQSPAELCRGLAAAGLPNLFIPSEDSFLEVPQVPILGTGKLDLKAIKRLAVEHFTPRTDPAGT